MTLKEYLLTGRHTQTSLAVEIGVTQGAVGHWITGRNQLQAEKVIPIFVATGGLVTPHEMRPDIYPDPKWVPPIKKAKKKR